MLPDNTSFLLESLLENSEIAGMLLLDINGTILKINAGVKHWLGYPESDLVGKNFSHLFTKEDQLQLKPQRELNTVLAHRCCSDNNYLVHKDGKYVWVNGESVLAKDTEGNSFIIKQFFDLSKEKKLQQDLIRTNKDLNNFVYAASHDLKAPISNLEGLLHVLGETLIEKGDTSTILSMMHESIKKFIGYLDDLAIKGRDEHKDSNQDLARIQFEEMLEEMEFNLMGQIKITHTRIESDFSTVPEMVFSRKNMRSLFFNLLSNAIKYRHVERTPEILIKTSKEDGFVVLTVQDNGIGISKDNKKKIFRLYERLHTHHEAQGTGVGMAIVHNIIENCGGKIEIESTVNEGTTFRLYLPIEIG